MKLQLLLPLLLLTGCASVAPYRYNCKTDRPPTKTETKIATTSLLTVIGGSLVYLTNLATLGSPAVAGASWGATAVGTAGLWGYGDAAYEYEAMHDFECEMRNER